MIYSDEIIAYSRKAVVSGNVVELYNYERPVLVYNQRMRTGRSSQADEAHKQENRKKNAARAKKRVRRLANANTDLKKFLTLTFKENITDLSDAHAAFDLFRRKMTRAYAGFKYIAVPEFQKRGAVHYHVLCNLPFVNVKKLAKAWRQGFIKINKIDNIDNVGAYIVKYMGKDNDDDRLVERRSYYCSQNLNEPIELREEENIDTLLSTLEDVKIKRMFSSEFVSEYCGRVSYVQLVLDKPCNARAAMSMREIAPDSPDYKLVGSLFDTFSSEKVYQLPIAELEMSC